MVQVGARGALGDAEHPSDLRVLESLDVVQHDHRPLPLAERLEHRGEPLALELRHFAECVRTRATPRVTGEDGIRALDLALRVAAAPIR